MAARCFAKYSFCSSFVKSSMLYTTYSLGKICSFSTQLQRFDGGTSHGSLGVIDVLSRHGFPKTSVHSFIQRNSFLLNSQPSNVEECFNILHTFGLSRVSLVSFLSSCPQLLDIEFLVKWRPLLMKVMKSKIPMPVFLKLVCDSEDLGSSDMPNFSSICKILCGVSTVDETVIKVLEEFLTVLAMKHSFVSNKIEFLKQIGLIRTDIDHVLGQFHGVLKLSVEKRLKPLFHEFWDFGFREHEGKKAIVIDPKLLSTELGEFSQCVEFLPTLRCRQSIMNEVIARGIFLAAINVKLRAYFLCKYGLNRRDAFKVLRNETRIILYDMKDLDKNINFLLQKFMFDILSLIDVPKFLGVNMEKTIVPRCKVIEHLKSIGGLGHELGLKDIIRPSKLKFYNLYVKPCPECENIFAKLCRIVEVKPKHPPGLWKMFKPLPYPETKEDLKNIRAFMDP